jgi:hypothetical protein
MFDRLLFVAIIVMTCLDYLAVYLFGLDVELFVLIVVNTTIAVTLYHTKIKGK